MSIAGYANKAIPKSILENQSKVIHARGNVLLFPHPLPHYKKKKGVKRREFGTGRVGRGDGREERKRI